MNKPFTLWTARRALLISAVALAAGCAQQAPKPQPAPEPVRLMTSGGFTAAHKLLAPQFTAQTGIAVESAYGSSMGASPTSIPNRLSKGEKADVVILARGALDDLAAKGLVRNGTQIDLVRSAVGVAVKKGAPIPDISSEDKLRQVLLNAKSIAYSASASGTYLSEELFPKLGVADRMKVTAKKIMSERVGAVVARGDAELGFQQASELLPFTELDYLGPLPDEVQQKVFFSAGVLKDAPNPEGARRFIRYLASPAAAGVIESTGLSPVARKP